MRLLIIHDNFARGDFLKKGFHHENLPCELLSLNDLMGDRNQALFYDGFFLLLQSDDQVAELCAFLRTLNSRAPISVLADDERPMLRDLRDEGQINFLSTRPFHVRVIARDMRYAVFFSKEQQDESKYVVRDIELDILSHSVRHKGVELKLRNREFALLHFLMANTGRVLSRTAILENVWDHNANFLTNTVDVHVSQLRKKIDNYADKKYIHTVPCAGYLFA